MTNHSIKKARITKTHQGALAGKSITNPTTAIRCAANLTRAGNPRRSSICEIAARNVVPRAEYQRLGASSKVGVLVGSAAALMLNERGVDTIPDIFEDEILTMLSNREIDAAAVTPTSVGYYNQTHPKQKLRLIHAFDGEPNFTWNIAIGMRRPDPELREKIDAAIDKMLADGTAKRIYARYGVELRPPK